MARLFISWGQDRRLLLDQHAQLERKDARASLPPGIQMRGLATISFKRPRTFINSLGFDIRDWPTSYDPAER
jgi:hypothetical protein